MGEVFLGLGPFQWLAILCALLTVFLLLDALAGHYRTAFRRWSQYTPFVSGGLLVLSALAVALWPQVNGVLGVFYWVSWLVVVNGWIGFGFHHVLGLARKPGGYRWTLHHLMYGAPQLAPLAFSATGVLGVLAHAGLSGSETIWGVELRDMLLAFVAVTLGLGLLQVWILHYRGAFNNPFMYLPMTAPLLVVPVGIWAVLAPGTFVLGTLSVLLWLTMLIGFIGLGMHLRGFDRQMGGLNVALFNLLEGPPAWAPGLFVLDSAVGLVAVHLLESSF